MKREIILEDAQHALSDALGTSYHVSVGSSSTMKVKRNTATGATVPVSSSPGMTTFRVSGDGLIVFKLINSLGIAAKGEPSARPSFRRNVLKVRSPYDDALAPAH